MTKTFTAEEIRAAIEEDGLRGIYHLIGPTPEEEAWAESLGRQLDALEPRCDWSNPAPSWTAHEYRDRWQRTMAALNEFESKYC